MKWILFFLFLNFSNAYAVENLLHVSFDTTRELFKDINKAFIETTNFKLKILQSHGGSGKQTSAIIHGLPADIVSLALPYHMDLLAEKKIVAPNWRELFPNDSSPLSTYIVFLVRKDNPKNIQDWSDLIREDVKVVSPNPKTSGGALWGYLAAWSYASRNFPEAPERYMQKLYKNIPVLDSSARNSSITFLKRNIGDVLITWANEAKYIVANIKQDYKIIEPSVNVKIHIPVSFTINRHHQKISKDYIEFLYSEKGQEIIRKHYYLPPNKDTLIIDIKNWKEFKKNHFGIDGVFEKIYR